MILEVILDLKEALGLANDKLLISFYLEREAYILSKIKELRKAYSDWFDITHRQIMGDKCKCPPMEAF